MVPAFFEHAERPTPAQPQTDAVLTLDETTGDVVGQVQPAFAVVRDRRAEHVVAHLLAVHVQFVIAQGADVGRSRGWDLVQRDRLAQPGERPLVVLHPIRADPRAAPVGRRERSHAERRRCRSTARARRSGPTRGLSTSSATPSPAACRHTAPTATGSIPPCPNPRVSPGRRPARWASRPRAPGTPSAPGRGPRAESPRKTRLRPIDAQRVRQTLAAQLFRRGGRPLRNRRQAGRSRHPRQQDTHSAHRRDSLQQLSANLPQSYAHFRGLGLRPDPVGTASQPTWLRLGRAGFVSSYSGFPTSEPFPNYCGRPAATSPGFSEKPGF